MSIQRQTFMIQIGLLMSLFVGFAIGMAAGTASADDEATAKPPAEQEEVTELSIPPLDYPVYPEDRPIWVDQPSNIETDWAELVVLSVPSLSADTSLNSLAQEQRTILNAYIDDYLKTQDAGKMINLAPERIEMLVDRQRTYDGKLTVEDGEMHQHASVLILDQKFHDRLTQQWEELQVGERLKGIGVLGFSAFVVLAGVTGLLRSISPREPKPVA